MKNTFKKGIISAALVVASASAFAGTSAGVFQWTGVVPVENINNGICIVPASGINGDVAHDSGLITFNNPVKTGSGDTEVTTYDVQSSTELAFTVVKTTPMGECDPGNYSPFNYQLTNLKVGINGGQLQNQQIAAPAGAGEWGIKHSTPGNMAQALTSEAVPSASTTVDAGTVVALTVDGKGLTVGAGDSVVVQAFILVNDNAPS